MAKFSDAFLQGLRGGGRRGSPTDPMLQRADQYGSSNPLAKSIGGMFGMQMDTGQELAAKEMSAIDQEAPDALMQSLAVSVKYARTPQEKMAALAKLTELKQIADLKKQKQTESSTFKTSLVTALTERNQKSLADIVSKIPNFENLPAEAQNRILSSAGITDPVEQKKALSSQGRLAADMGFIPGTQDFSNKVEQISKVENQTGSAEVLKAFTSAVNTLVPLEKTAQVNNAVVALSQGDKPGADTVQLESIMAIAGSKQRAEAAYRRLEQSAAIDERISNSLNKFFTGTVSTPTFEAREFLVYSALQQQKQALDQVVSNTATTLSVPEDKVKPIRAMFDFTGSTKEWESRFENKYFPKTEKKGTPRKSSADVETEKRKAALIDLQRRRRASQPTPPQ